MQKTMVGKIRRLGMAAALVAGSGLANAAVIKATWDPPYGPAFPGLAFTGEAEFYVPDSLLNVGAIGVPTFFGDIPACAGGATGPTCISLRSAFVDLYTFTGIYSTTNRDLQERLTYAAPVGLYGSTVTPDPLLGVVLRYDSVTERNEVIGASSLLFGPVAPTDPEVTAILAGSALLPLTDAFFMRLGPGGTDPESGTSLPGGADAPYALSSLFSCRYDGDFCFTSNDVNAQSNPAPVVFSRVPEPGSLALVLGALAAGWAARRSRRPVEPAAC